MAKIKMITLNIEGDKHLDLVIPFLVNERPDVVCLQEVFEKDVEYIKRSLSMEGDFVPCMFINEENAPGFSVGNAWGVLILTNSLEYSISEKYYSRLSNDLPNFGYKNPNVAHRVLLILETKKDEKEFRIITTHFTWTPDGKTSDLQREHVKKMIEILRSYSSFILCGDFNAPRGEEIWGDLSKEYTDNIPPEVTSTLDPNLHHVENLHLVIDGIFSTPDLSVSDVQVVGGLSDHQAIVAMVNK